ncbi:Ig-like domain-containing domain [Dyadobacter tibetensis]|uniref:Ig-like domain-containing domain n=1 Tax=Dyadobacter tibetensis TaxID=1211851 RepID=UPI00046F49F4|nr:Ig-like domain-containing domain [Dyadobacter tibetensis]
MILRTIIFACSILLIFGRCAQVVAPTGGKKDSIAPQLVQSIPSNKTVNFQGNRIELLFDEYIIVDNINQKLVITPEADNPYSYKLNDETLVLNFKKKFEDSTTYTLNFGDAVKDFSEKNPAKNLKIVFSTGPKLDSGRVYGRVKDLKTNQPILDVLVGLYPPSDTLDPVKQKPYYFSRTDSSGIFSIENIQVKPYRIIAVEDKNRNMLFNSKDERIGFLTDPIPGNSDSTFYNLDMVISDNSMLRIQRTLPKVNDYTVIFNKGLESAKIRFTEGDTLPHVVTADQIKFYNVGTHPDSIQVEIAVTDSLGTDSTFQQKITFLQQRGKTPQKDPFNLNSRPENNRPLSLNLHSQFNFNKPVSILDTESIMLVRDSTSSTALSKFEMEWNPYRTELIVKGKVVAKDSLKWQFPKGAVISIEQDTLPATTIKHPVLDNEDYGTLAGSILIADSSQSFIVELVDEKYKVVRSAKESPYHFTEIPEGKYFLRLILDDNKNGRWDSGQFQKAMQPERIVYYQEVLNIKSNFEFSNINISVDNPK